MLRGICIIKISESLLPYDPVRPSHNRIKVRKKEWRDNATDEVLLKLIRICLFLKKRKKIMLEKVCHKVIEALLIFLKIKEEIEGLGDRIEEINKEILKEYPERYYKMKTDNYDNIIITDVLNTEPVCLIYGRYHPYAADLILESLRKKHRWLRKHSEESLKMEEERLKLKEIKNDK